MSFWFVNSVRLRQHDAHRIERQSLTVSMAVMRRLCQRVPAHFVTLESMYKSSVVLAATIACAHLSHLQRAHRKYPTWGAMGTHQLTDKERWGNAAMCDTLQLN